MSLFRTTLFAAFAAACTTPTTQIVTGTAADALAVRAISGDTVVTESAVATDGSFSLALPADREYRLEVLTTAGAEQVYADTSTALTQLTFKVCQPEGPVDLGAIAPHSHGGSGSDSGSGSMGSGMCGGHGSDGDHGHGGGPGSGDEGSGWGPPLCGSDANGCPPPDGGSGMCPDHPPGNIGC